MWNDFRIIFCYDFKRFLRPKQCSAFTNFVTKRRAISGVAEENIVAVGRISGSPVE